MSSYIAVELDVLSAAPNAARAAGVDEDTILGGLNRLWAYAFRAKRDVLHELEVRGCFATQVDVLPTLRAFGWLADAPDGMLRVKGADRYLRISEARSKGGKAASGNLKRGNRQPELKPGSPPAAAGDQPGTSSGSFPALTPSSEHRTPNTTTEEAAAAADKSQGAITWSAPKTDPTTWNGVDFFAWFQASRQELGLIGEKFPKKPLGPWLNEVLMTEGMTIHRLMDAVPAYGRSEHWRTRTPPLPWAGFASEWRRFVPALGEAA